MGDTPDDKDPALEDDLFEGEFDVDDGYVSESVRRRIEALVPELVRKTFAAGMGAMLTTEEGLRKLAKEMRVPKEVAGYLVSTASSTKDEFLRILAREVREFLQTINLSEEIAKMLTTLSFEVKTEIRFIPNEEKYTGVEPDVKAKVRLRRTDEDSSQSGDSDEGDQRGSRRRRRFTRRRDRGAE